MDPDELDALLRKIHAVYLGAVAYSDYLFGLLGRYSVIMMTREIQIRVGIHGCCN